jgi:hypothetical protein
LVEIRGARERKKADAVEQRPRSQSLANEGSNSCRGVVCVNPVPDVVEVVVGVVEVECSEGVLGAAGGVVAVPYAPVLIAVLVLPAVVLAALIGRSLIAGLRRKKKAMSTRASWGLRAANASCSRSLPVANRPTLGRESAV